MSVYAITSVMKYRGKIGSGARFTALILADSVYKDTGECFPSIKTIAEKTEFTPNTVRKHLGMLAADGLLEITPTYRPDGGRTSNRYRLTFPAPGQEPEAPPAENHSTPPPKNCKVPPRSNCEGHSYEPLENEPEQLPARPKKARRAAGKATDNGLNGQQVVAAWINLWKERGEEQPAATGPVVAAAKALAPLFRDVDHAKASLRRYREDSSRFLVENAWGLQHMMSRIDKYLHEAAPKPAENEGDAPYVYPIGKPKW